MSYIMISALLTLGGLYIIVVAIALIFDLD